MLFCVLVVVIETLRPRFGHHLLQTYDKLWLTRLRAVSLFSWSVEQNARDTQMTTRVTEDARRERHGCRPQFSRLAASSLNARARVHLLNLKKKRGCSQSRLDRNIYSFYCTFLIFFSTHSTFFTLRAPYFSPGAHLMGSCFHLTCHYL